MRKIKRIMFVQMDSVLSQMKEELEESSQVLEGVSEEIESSQMVEQGWQGFVDKANNADLPELANKAGIRKARAESHTSRLTTRFEQECRKRMMLEREMDSTAEKVRVLKDFSYNSCCKKN